MTRSHSIAFCLSSLFFGVTLQLVAVVPSDKPDAYPNWWFERGVVGLQPFQDGDVYADFLQPSDFSVLNQGQLLHIADMGIAELNEKFSIVGGVNFEVTDFRESTADSDPYAVANLGQLKFVSSKFYDFFQEVGYTPVAPDAMSPGQFSPIPLNAEKVDGSLSGVAVYPWIDNRTSSNFSAAVIGQVKYLFSWDLTGFSPSTEDLDGDGIYDLWELRFSSDPSGDLEPNVDLDGDGYSNLTEFGLRTDPTEFSFSLPGGVVIQEWNPVEITLPSISSFTESSAYPDAPTEKYFSPVVQKTPPLPHPQDGKYGTRILGYIVPEETGNYQFWLKVGGAVEFWLTSTGDDTGDRRNATQITAFTQMNSQSAWGEAGSPVSLNEGQRYFFAILHLGHQYTFNYQGTHTAYFDDLTLGWTAPGEPASEIEIIDENVLWSFNPKDMDGDETPDSFEQLVIDYDSSTYPDVWAVLPSADVEPDGFSNMEEYLSGTNPVVVDDPRFADTDQDGMADGIELDIIEADTSGLLNNLSDVKPEDDFDGDSFSNLYEFLNGTDPITSNPFGVSISNPDSQEVILID